MSTKQRFGASLEFRPSKTDNTFVIATQRVWPKQFSRANQIVCGCLVFLVVAATAAGVRTQQLEARRISARPTATGSRSTHSEDLKDQVQSSIDLPFPSQADVSRQQLVSFGPAGIGFIVEAIRSDAKINPVKKAFLVDVIDRMDSAESESALITLLSDRAGHVRGLAATYLGGRRSTSSIPYLIKRLNDGAIYVTTVSTHPDSVQHVLVRDVAIQALEKITGSVLLPGGSKKEQAEEWRRWWKTPDNTKGNPERSTYVDYVCQDQQKIYLRLHNNTLWNISVTTDELYYPSKTPIQLLNGVKTYAAPNDKEVSLQYRIERSDSSQDAAVLEIAYPDNGFSSWIAPRDSILFAVPRAYLGRDLKVDVRFNYEWEITKQGHLLQDQEHKLSFGSMGISNAKSCPAGLGTRTKVIPNDTLSSRPDEVKVRFDVDGTEKISEKFSILIYADNQLVIPQLTENGFIVPPEIRRHQQVAVRFISGKYDLYFGSVNDFDFSSEWKIGIDTPPFDSQYLLSPPKPNQELLAIYYMQFLPKDAEGTIIAVQVYK